MEAVRLGMIGCGYFARFHLHSWRELADEGGVRLAAVCDRDADRAEEAAAHFGADRWYTDASAMLAAEQLDLVDIATRMEEHRVLVELAAGYRVGAIVQKPMAPAWADCVAMVAAADAAGVFYAVHENFRFQAPMLRVKRIIDSGEIGAPTWARIGFRTGFDVYANQPYLADEPRLVILDLGIHILDLARFFMGEVAHVSCETQRRGPRPRAEDTATVLLKHVSGAVSLAECTYENRRSDRAETLVEIEALRGGVEVGPGGAITVTTAGGSRKETVALPDFAWAEPPLEFVQDSVRATCRHMLESVRAGCPADTSGRDNLKTFALVEAAYQAAAMQCAVAPTA